MKNKDKYVHKIEGKPHVHNTLNVIKSKNVIDKPGDSVSSDFDFSSSGFCRVSCFCSAEVLVWPTCKHLSQMMVNYLASKQT